MLRRVFLVFLSLTMIAMLAVGCRSEKAPTGALVDEVVFTAEESHAAAVRKLQAGDIDIFAHPITDPDLFDSILEDPNLEYQFNYGAYREIRFNTVGPTFPATGELNPFSVPAIREAFNWLIDRNYMVEEYLGGLGTPKWTALGTAFPDHAVRYPHIVEAIEEHYAYNPDKAKEVVEQEMQKLGASKVNGIWHFEEEPVEIKVLIRADLPPFPDAGHYIADLVEDLGFVVDRMVRTGADASPIWIGSHPNEGLMHIYTGGWISPTIPRDAGGNFDQFYTHRVMPFPLWGVLEEQLKDFPALDEASHKLRQKEFTTMEQREQLFETVLWEAMKFSNQIWLMDVAGASPYRSDVDVAADVAGGIGDPSWVFTAHRHKDGVPEPGGTLRMAVPNLLLDPWNPVEGSAWSYDMLFTRRAVGGIGVLPDPRDGLYWPQRIERAEVTVQEGLPVDVTHDWLTLEFVSEIQVPADAWADWDAQKQEFITVQERFGAAGTTALRKSVVYYPEDLYSVPLHDGSELSIGDFILAMIMQFDRAKEGSAIFDEGEVAGFNAFMSSFKAVKIVSEKPLIIETYSDLWYMDAEMNVTAWYPQYGTYAWSGYWHMISLGILAETDRVLTFSNNKADMLEVDWMDYTKGPSLPILKDRLDRAIADNYIPYAPTLSNYISADEAQNRWSNLKEFYEERGHFWVGTGPYIIKSVHPVEKIVVLEPFADYPDLSDKWFFFMEPLDMIE